MKAGRFGLIAIVIVSIAVLIGAAGMVRKEAAGGSGIIIGGSSDSDEVIPGAIANTERTGGSKVYFTQDISAKGLFEVYKALEKDVTGNVAIKLHMGEPGNQNYLNPDLLRDLVNAVGGSFVDSNTYYGGRRTNTAGHLAAAREHGFTYAPVDILDSGGEIKLPIGNGRHLKEALMGANIMNYDWIISVAHFKGHSQAGYGGTFKNLAIGIATPAGKGIIHGGSLSSAGGNTFHERIIEYNMALLDAKPGRVLYINVLNKLSIDCDCMARAAAPTIADIGIMASLDPVALDKASIDQIYLRPESERRHLTERIESRNGIQQVVYGERMGLGSQYYELIRLPR